MEGKQLVVVEGLARECTLECTWAPFVEMPALSSCTLYILS
jgi:hypothetical protein